MRFKGIRLWEIGLCELGFVRNRIMRNEIMLNGMHLQHLIYLLDLLMLQYHQHTNALIFFLLLF